MIAEERRLAAERADRRAARERSGRARSLTAAPACDSPR